MRGVRTVAALAQRLAQHEQGHLTADALAAHVHLEQLQHRKRRIILAARRHSGLSGEHARKSRGTIGASVSSESVFSVSTATSA